VDRMVDAAAMVALIWLWPRGPGRYASSIASSGYSETRTEALVANIADVVNFELPVTARDPTTRRSVVPVRASSEFPPILRAWFGR
jgi:hypothetical protein